MFELATQELRGLDDTQLRALIVRLCEAEVVALGAFAGLCGGATHRLLPTAGST
ncbi:MAG: hypothetical protein AVDCRST_MAG15-2924 [uncultured Rubellimicrobium sp.]|uniref:Uncharacterized protein n=1 Tax=uncultured Rubellimicrobium sp. TaxID=543078 RepID=A0A6J4Q267_9RHOB|nr:MAG: hypothetical protein AVDCRST_MAG15-2924 [uncultured Rubellimicrobium sp.]